MAKKNEETVTVCGGMKAPKLPKKKQTKKKGKA